MKVLLSLIFFAIAQWSFSQTIDITSLSSDSLCNKGFFQINYQATGQFNPGNVFYAEISDANGSFASPIAITFTSSAANGQVGNSMPLNGLPAGNGYRIRMVASDPLTYGTDNGFDLPLIYPDVNVDVQPNQILATTTVPGTQFQWLECSHTPLTGETNALFTNGAAGTEYAIEVTQLGCVDTSSCEVFLASNSLLETTNRISIGPNPTNGFISIDFQEIISNATVFLYDVNGRVVQTSGIQNDDTLTMKIEQDSGMYQLCVITDAGQRFEYRILKE